MKKYQSRQYCSGCHDDFYNCGGVDGNTKQCWSMKSAKIIWRCMISIDELPANYHKYRKRRMPSCYHRPRYCFPRAVNPNDR